MQAKDVLALCESFAGKNIDVWLDGGWGVDALLGKQTRPHEDLDIIIEEKNLPKMRELLEAKGYKDVSRDDTRPWNFVLGDMGGRLVDVHAFSFDENGNGVYGNHGPAFPAECFKGRGTVLEKEVKCISAEQIVKFHTQYEPDENDVKDVTALCERFGIELPNIYRQNRRA